MADMLGRDEAVSAEEALRLLLESFPTSGLTRAVVSLDEACGRVLSEDVESPEDLPGFSRSTVDGFAVLSRDTYGATEGSPAYLEVTREILMGEEPGFELAPGEAARISTGGMLPGGADAVVMLEHAQFLDERSIEVLRPVAQGENVIQRGEDARKGEVVLGKGHRLRPQDVAVLAGLGVARAPVYERPVVSIISTGDEVVPPEARLRPGLVRDMNSYNLAGLVTREGGSAVRMGIFRDEYDSIREAFDRAVRESDMVLVSGGSSVGSRDMTARIMADAGTVLFHSVSIKPGKPLIAGIASGKPVFGLPGHPRAVSVCFDNFVAPVLRRLAGLAPEGASGLGRTVRARLAKSVSSSPGRQEYISVYLETVDGELHAVPVPAKSGLITAAVRGQGTVCVPAGSSGIEKGETVEVRLS
ncbi:MAG: molybdopterin-binding protein [Thermodesulfovibrionales bacterium]